MFVTKPPTRTSTAAIIESLRQDNALRLDLIKNMKNGLSSIANGVLNQDYDFCNALDWLKESLEQVSRSHDESRSLNFTDRIPRPVRMRPQFIKKS